MLALDVQKVTARSGEESKLEFTSGAAISDATTQSKTAPYWEKVGTEWVYKKKMFVDDLGRAMIDRVSLSIGKNLRKPFHRPGFDSMSLLKFYNLFRLMRENHRWIRDRGPHRYED